MFPDINVLVWRKVFDEKTMNNVIGAEMRRGCLMPRVPQPPPVSICPPMSVLKACGEWQRPVMTIMCCSGAKKNTVFVRHKPWSMDTRLLSLWRRLLLSSSAVRFKSNQLWNLLDMFLALSFLQLSTAMLIRILPPLLNYYSSDVWSCETFIFWTKSLEEYFGIIIIPRLKDDFSSLT